MKNLKMKLLTGAITAMTFICAGCVCFAADNEGTNEGFSDITVTCDEDSSLNEEAAKTNSDTGKQRTTGKKKPSNGKMKKPERGTQTPSGNKIDRPKRGTQSSTDGKTTKKEKKAQSSADGTTKTRGKKGKQSSTDNSVKQSKDLTRI